MKNDFSEPFLLRTVEYGKNNILLNQQLFQQSPKILWIVDSVERYFSSFKSARMRAVTKKTRPSFGHKLRHINIPSKSESAVLGFLVTEVFSRTRWCKYPLSDVQALENTVYELFWTVRKIRVYAFYRPGNKITSEWTIMDVRFIAVGYLRN